MTEKLVKTGNDYILYSKDKTVLGITSGTMEGRMLSLKNCESIANGYDLDELVKEQYPIDEPSFKRGFKLALEILGDKKFSEEDMIEFAKWTFLEVGSNTGKDRTNEQLLLEWKSIQQTEFDVEIVKVKTPDGIFRENDVPYASIKLDEDGCLILKRK